MSEVIDPGFPSTVGGALSGGAPPEKRKHKLGYQRTAVACHHCRRRKIRCMAGQIRAKCHNCARLGKDCSFENDPDSSDPNNSDPTGMSGRTLSSKNSFGTSPSPNSLYGHRLGQDYDTLHSIPPMHPAAFPYDPSQVPVYDRHMLGGVPSSLPQLTSQLSPQQQQQQQQQTMGQWPLQSPSSSAYAVSQTPSSDSTYLSSAPQYPHAHGAMDVYGDPNRGAEYQRSIHDSHQPLYVSPQQVPSQPLSVQVGQGTQQPLSGPSEVAQVPSYLNPQVPWHEYAPSLYDGMYRHDSGNSSWTNGSDQGLDSRGRDANPGSYYAASNTLSRIKSNKSEPPG